MFKTYFCVRSHCQPETPKTGNRFGHDQVEPSTLFHMAGCYIQLSLTMIHVDLIYFMVENSHFLTKVLSFGRGMCKKYCTKVKNN